MSQTQMHIPKYAVKKEFCTVAGAILFKRTYLKPGTKTRLRGRFTPENFRKIHFKYHSTAQRFANRQSKKGIVYKSTSLIGCTHCMGSEMFADDFHKAYPHYINPYYNDISLKDAVELVSMGFIVDKWELYIYNKEN